MKKVLLIVVDALSSHVVLPAFDAGRLPNLRRLSEAGAIMPECISVFPSITPAATAAIGTGTFPREHGIAGAYWFDTGEQQVIHYGWDFWIVYHQGFGDFLQDFVIRMNHERLKAETLFERVERDGLSAACLNFLIYRGLVPHELNMPLLGRLIPGVPAQTTLCGPEILAVGEVVDTCLPRTGEPLRVSGGVANRYGMGDLGTGELLLDLAVKHALPDFTLAYFPDNDLRSHEVGPRDALPVLEDFDRRLGEVIQAYDGYDRFLQDFAVFILGDHSQSDIDANPERANIILDDVLEPFTLAPAGRGWEHDEDLVACPNLRFAQIYLREPTAERLHQVVARLLEDERVDQVLWNGRRFEPMTDHFHVATADRGHLAFRPGEGDPNRGTDRYGCEWTWSGQLAAVGGRLTAAGGLGFHDYPDAFERIVGALGFDAGGEVWVTARPGSEFSLRHLEIHVGGGSHGSLHRGDSIVPLIAAGLPGDDPLAANLRTVDVAPMVLGALGLAPQRAVGVSHISTPASSRK